MNTFVLSLRENRSRNKYPKGRDHADTQIQVTWKLSHITVYIYHQLLIKSFPERARTWIRQCAYMTSDKNMQKIYLMFHVELQIMRTHMTVTVPLAKNFISSTFSLVSPLLICCTNFLYSFDLRSRSSSPPSGAAIP